MYENLITSSNIYIYNSAKRWLWSESSFRVIVLMHSQLHHGGASMICGSVDALFGFKWICRTFII